MDFVCPKCRGVLRLLGGTNTKKCENNHSFDKARAGYYNLLLGVGGGTHGDNAEMVEARRNFLSRGYYSPLAERLAELVLLHTPSGACILDAGCGEGYYTDTVERAVAERDGFSDLIAFDISKDAVKNAYRRNKQVSYAVASAYDMPIADGTVSTVYNAFSPLALSETARVLKKGGKFIFVYPGRDHLFTLKSKIYSTPYRNDPQDTYLEGFTCIGNEVLKYDIELADADSIRSLFMMTPYAYRTSAADRERVLSLESLVTEAEFCITVYEKN